MQLNPPNSFIGPRMEVFEKWKKIQEDRIARACLSLQKCRSRLIPSHLVSSMIRATSSPYHHHSPRQLHPNRNVLGDDPLRRRFRDRKVSLGEGRRGESGRSALGRHPAVGEGLHPPTLGFRRAHWRGQGGLLALKCSRVG